VERKLIGDHDNYGTRSRREEGHMITSETIRWRKDGKGQSSG